MFKFKDLFMNYKNLLLIFCSIFLVYSCNDSYNKNEFVVEEYTPVMNYQTENKGTKVIETDYTDAIDSGFVIPSTRQVSGGQFVFHFTIKNNGKSPINYFYKI